jgi:hypothetical protein
MPTPQASIEASVTDDELAWDLADAARGHLDATQRNEVYIAIAVGDSLWAVTLLLRAVVRRKLSVRAHLMRKLLWWVTSYRGHPEQPGLLHLIGRVEVEPAGAPQALRWATSGHSHRRPARHLPASPNRTPAFGVFSNDELR